MIRRFVVLAVLGMMFVYSLGTCLAKPLPPESLNNVIVLLAEFEESYESEEWDKATSIVDEIEKGLNKASGSIPTGGQNYFSNPLKGLQYAIAQKNEELTERAYIRLQNKIFLFASHFQYDTHPIFSLINKYIGEEATEAVESEKFDEVISELREVAGILKNSKNIIIENGVTETEIQVFHEKLQSVVIAAKSKDKKAVYESLEAAKQYFTMISS